MIKQYYTSVVKGAAMRPFEYEILFDDDGGLTLHWLNENLHETKFIKLLPATIRPSDRQMFNDRNFNLSEHVLKTKESKLLITCYSNGGDETLSIYPKACFTFITREQFSEQVIRTFKTARLQFPDVFGAEYIGTQILETTTKGETKMNLDFNKLGKEIVSDNIQFAKFEAERKIGQAALDVSIEAFCKQFPSFRQTADTNIGKLAIANIVRVLGNQYKGANKEAVDMFTSAVMRGGYASAGDSIDLEKMFDGLVDKFKNIIPTGLISGTTETSEQ